MAVRIARLLRSEYDDAAELIHDSTNQWTLKASGKVAFNCLPTDCRLFPDMYDVTDYGECIAAYDIDSGRLVGTCYLHPRDTHIGVGIVNTAPDIAGSGVASTMIRDACQIADAACLPLRLLSSASNMDSYSLYHRAGFTTRTVFQDIHFCVTAHLLDSPSSPSTMGIRLATLDDVSAITDLEKRLTGIVRPQDWSYLIGHGIPFQVLLIEGPGAILMGVLNATNHPANCTLGPAVAVSEAAMSSLLFASLPFVMDRTVLVLAAPTAQYLCNLLYQWGGRNTDIHLLQVRGEYTEPLGVQLMSFLPESA